MTKAMAEAGAGVVMVVTPCYFKSLMNNQALEQHYMKVYEKYAFCMRQVPFAFEFESER